MALFLGACEKKSLSKDSFNVYLGPEPSHLDWQMAREKTSMGIIYNIMAGLFDYDLSQQEIVVIPRLAESHTNDAKAMNWTFEIKKVQWSDGTPLTAQHFLDAWKRLLTAETASPHAHRLFIIKGAQEFYKKQIPFQQVGIKANGNTLTVELNKSFIELPKLLTGFFTFPIRKDLIKASIFDTTVG
ncbi:MAG: ABC transporter substrate-binding protein, partial [Bdellovibrionales bacterium]|nr:ABC transporter substrate-binding protein [Bdellovibrionales bacterium]